MCKFHCENDTLSLIKRDAMEHGQKDSRAGRMAIGPTWFTETEPPLLAEYHMQTRITVLRLVSDMYFGHAAPARHAMPCPILAPRRVTFFTYSSPVG